MNIQEQRERLRGIFGDVVIDILNTLVREQFNDALEPDEMASARNEAAAVVDGFADDMVKVIMDLPEEAIRQSARNGLLPLVRAALVAREP